MILIRDVNLMHERGNELNVAFTGELLTITLTSIDCTTQTGHFLQRY